MSSNHYISSEPHVFEGRQKLTLLILALLPVVLMFISLLMGRYPISISTVLNVLLGQGLSTPETVSDPIVTVLYNIRLPRIILACMIGLCLSGAGAAYQGVFQNPMAAPDLLGATSGAAFGAALAILMGWSSPMISLSAFAFSMVAVACVYVLGKKAPGSRVLSLILAGMMIGSLFTAGTSFIKLVADPTNQLPAITYWLMGSLAGASQHTVLWIALPMSLGIIPLLLLRWQLNLLTLGDEVALTMGVNPDRLRLIVILSATLMTAAAVSVSGMIGWVGLVIPHLARKLIGNNYQYLMPASMLLGASFMLVIDTVSRNLLAVEIPIGILTAFIGAPFFAYLIFMKEGVSE